MFLIKIPSKHFLTKGNPLSKASSLCKIFISFFGKIFLGLFNIFFAMKYINKNKFSEININNKHLDIFFWDLGFFLEGFFDSMLIKGF